MRALLKSGILFLVILWILNKGRWFSPSTWAKAVAGWLLERFPKKGMSTSDAQSEVKHVGGRRGRKAPAKREDISFHQWLYSRCLSVEGKPAGHFSVPQVVSCPAVQMLNFTATLNEHPSLVLGSFIPTEELGILWQTSPMGAERWLEGPWRAYSFIIVFLACRWSTSCTQEQKFY